MPTDLSKYVKAFDELVDRRTATEIQNEMKRELFKRMYNNTQPFDVKTYHEACDAIMHNKVMEYEMPATPVPTFKEKHYTKLAAILSLSMRDINKEIDARHHDAVHRAMTLVVQRMMSEMMVDNPLFKRDLFIKAITESASKKL